RAPMTKPSSRPMRQKSRPPPNHQPPPNPPPARSRASGRAELGHRHDDWRRQRLFGLHDLVHDQGGLLSIDVFRARLQYPDLRRKIASLVVRYGAETILIEKAGPGLTLLQDLRSDLPNGMTRPIGVKPEGSKADRMVAQSAKIEAGHVHLPRQAD